MLVKSCLIFFVCLLTQGALAQESPSLLQLRESMAENQCWEFSCGDYMRGVSVFNNSDNNGIVHFSSDDLDLLLYDSLTVASMVLSDQVLDEDKSLHYIGGVYVGRFAGELCSQLDFNSSLSKPQINFICSAGASALVGLLKELYDRKHGGQVEAEDAVATAAGGFTVSWRWNFKK